MTQRPRDTTEQPLRETFLQLLEPEVRQSLMAAFFHVENALLETYSDTGSDRRPFPCVFADAVLGEIQSLTYHVGATVEEWVPPDDPDATSAELRLYEELNRLTQVLEVRRHAIEKARDRLLTDTQDGDTR